MKYFYFFDFFDFSVFPERAIGKSASPGPSRPFNRAVQSKGVPFGRLSSPRVLPLVLMAHFDFFDLFYLFLPFLILLKEQLVNLLFLEHHSL